MEVKVIREDLSISSLAWRELNWRVQKKRNRGRGELPLSKGMKKRKDRAKARQNKRERN